MYPKNKPHKFFLSVLSAIGTGILVSFMAISGIKLVTDVLITTHLSKSIVYNSVDKQIDTRAVFSGRETIQNAKSSIKVQHKSISASSYIVVDLDTNKILLEKNADTLLPIASVTKLVTAVVAKRLMKGNKQIEITKDILSTNGNTASFRLGEKFTLDEIMYPLLMVSSNDSAEAIARTYGRKNFIKEMNDWANSIGAYRTYFRDPSGLSVENVSTARDIVTISKWIQKNMPDIISITHTKSKTIRVHTWINPTHFLNLSAYVGGKNGYTPEANRTGLALFKLGKPEKIYATVLLGSSYRDEDTLDVLDEALKWK